MTIVQDIPFTPFFLEGTEGNLLSVYFPPVGPERGNYICIPPFAEEMNRCRSMMSMQARSMALQGVGVLLLDLYGTGDSDGAFSDCCWEIWKQDILTAIAWFSTQKRPLTGLWGIRLGCILAAEIMHEKKLSFERILFWQPVIDGKIMLTQFLRIRIAAALDQSGIKETTSQMREALALGEQVEVGGYSLCRELTLSVDSRKMDQLLPICDVEIVWLEQLDESLGLSPASQLLIDAQMERGSKISVVGFSGPAFWQLHERTLAPNLIELTTNFCLA